MYNVNKLCFAGQIDRQTNRGRSQQLQRLVQMMVDVTAELHNNTTIPQNHDNVMSTIIFISGLYTSGHKSLRAHNIIFLKTINYFEIFSSSPISNIMLLISFSQLCYIKLIQWSFENNEKKVLQVFDFVQTPCKITCRLRNAGALF